MHATWYALHRVVVVIAVDLSRAVVSWRAAVGTTAPAFGSNALSTSRATCSARPRCSFGLLLVRGGHPRADSRGRTFVAVLVWAPQPGG